MRCEDVRPLLPDLSEGNLRVAGDVELHLVTCTDCSTEMSRYRTVILEMAALRDELAEPSGDLVERVLAEMPERNWRMRVHRAAANERVHYAALSLGGVAVGATAIALLWRRSARRGLSIEHPTATA